MPAAGIRRDTQSEKKKNERHEAIKILQGQSGSKEAELKMILARVICSLNFKADIHDLR